MPKGPGVNEGVVESKSPFTVKSSQGEFLQTSGENMEENMEKIATQSSKCEETNLQATHTEDRQIKPLPV
jgi:hypothetical protein